MAVVSSVTTAMAVIIKQPTKYIGKQLNSYNVKSSLIHHSNNQNEIFSDVDELCLDPDGSTNWMGKPSADAWARNGGRLGTESNILLEGTRGR